MSATKQEVVGVVGVVELPRPSTPPTAPPGNTKSPAAIASELTKLVERVKQEIANNQQEVAQLQEAITLSQNQQAERLRELARSETILGYLADAVAFAETGQLELAGRRAQAVIETVRPALQPALRQAAPANHAGRMRWSGAVWGRCKSCGTQGTPHANQGYCETCWALPKIRRVAAEDEQRRITKLRTAFQERRARGLASASSALPTRK